MGRSGAMATLGPAARVLAVGLAVAFAMAPGSPRAAAQGVEPQLTAMTRIVLDQLAAFRRDDWSAAYGYASSAIQAQFSPESFRQMVIGGYAAIARSLQGTVLRAEALDTRRGLVEIRVDGVDGETVDALYELVEEFGAWRINGVVTRPATRGSTARLAAPVVEARSGPRR
jgi:hypothetical protein